MVGRVGKRRGDQCGGKGGGSASSLSLSACSSVWSTSRGAHSLTVSCDPPSEEDRVSSCCLVPGGHLHEVLQQLGGGGWTGEGLGNEASEKMFSSDQQTVNFLVVLITLSSIHPLFILPPWEIYRGPLSGSVFSVR